MHEKTLRSKTLTVRLPSELYASAQAIAKKRSVSLNVVVQESLTNTIRDAREQYRFDEYTELGTDSEMCDIEYAVHAQAEVMLGSERE